MSMLFLKWATPDQTMSSCMCSSAVVSTTWPEWWEWRTVCHVHGNNV